MRVFYIRYSLHLHLLFVQLGIRGVMAYKRCRQAFGSRETAAYLRKQADGLGAMVTTVSKSA